METDDRNHCGCYWNRETGYFEPCCEAHEQEYVEFLEQQKGKLDVTLPKE